MEGLTILGIVLGYFFVGTIFAGIITRGMRGDSTMVPPCVIIWPVVMPICFMIWVYGLIIGKPFHQVAK